MTSDTESANCIIFPLIYLCMHFIILCFVCFVLLRIYLWLCDQELTLGFRRGSPKPSQLHARQMPNLLCNLSEHVPIYLEY